MSSSALSSAKKRRATNTSNDSDNNFQNNNIQNTQSRAPNTQTRMPININTLFQTINTRISKLEKNSNTQPNQQSIIDNDEINTRFDILVNEIADIKDMLLKLQTFTMEVNKSLYNERINLLSTIDDTNLNIDDTEILDENEIINDISGN
tara:strand:+ start:536 stop:985 length:450 start_codon:yes stop_codon:yes gene_type:complete